MRLLVEPNPSEEEDLLNEEVMVLRHFLDQSAHHPQNPRDYEITYVETEQKTSGANTTVMLSYNDGEDTAMLYMESKKINDQNSGRDIVIVTHELVDGTPDDLDYFEKNKNIIKSTYIIFAEMLIYLTGLFMATF